MDYQLLTGKFLSSPLTTRTFKNLAECDSFIEHNLCAERIFFAGGEPLLHAEHYQILNRLVQNDKTDCTLAYITNLSTLNLQKNYVIDYWKHFKNVELTISLDAIGKLGEYIRDGLNWNEFSNNIQQIKNEVPHVKLSVNITVSLLNLVDVPATVDYCLKELAIDSDSIILAPVTSPLVYRITLIPKGAKQKIATHLLKASENFPVSLKNQISGIVAYMLSADESDSWKLFLAHNKRMDQLRSQSFVTVSNLLNDIDN
jgi:sulfatase maturation enzyme AslB (radical SAM superfamily)